MIDGVRNAFLLEPPPLPLPAGQALLRHARYRLREGYLVKIAAATGELQGFYQTVFDAIFHVVGHFSYHTGQIVMLAKWHAGDRIHLYDDVRLNQAP